MTNIPNRGIITIDNIIAIDQKHILARGCRLPGCSRKSECFFLLKERNSVFFADSDSFRIPDAALNLTDVSTAEHEHTKS